MTFPNKITLYIENGNILRIRGLEQPIIQDDGSLVRVPINDATVLGTLLDGNGVEVDGASNLIFSPIGSPQVGDYWATTGNDFDPAPGGGYLLELTGSGTAAGFKPKIRVEVEDRRS